LCLNGIEQTEGDFRRKLVFIFRFRKPAILQTKIAANEEVKCISFLFFKKNQEKMWNMPYLMKLDKECVFVKRFMEN